ncbi:MAG: ABC transporter ATP-binding protein [Bacteroidota bacterium]
MKEEWIIECRKLSYTFPDGGIGVEDVSFGVNKGDFLLLTGPNGSGKTLLSRLLIGLLKPSKGEVLLENSAIGQQLELVRQKVGLIFQDPNHQIVGQDVQEEIAFGPENLAWPRERIKKAVATVMERMSLTHLSKRRPHSLSGGEKRRLVLAGILVMEPEVIIFDEPFVGLDYKGCVAILQQMLDLHQDGKTLMVISHDVEKILAHVNRVIILSKGKIVADSEAESALRQFKQYDIRVPYGEDRPIDSMTWLE